MKEVLELVAYKKEEVKKGNKEREVKKKLQE